MLFRYKVTKCGYDGIDYAFHGPGICYRVEIQYYKPNSKWFKWRYFKTAQLCYVMNKLGHCTDDIDTNIGLFNEMQKYDNIGDIVFKYIKKIMEDKNCEKFKNDIRSQIDEFVVTNDWNTIEIKENE